MWNDAHDAYLEERVLSASPVELVAMLYQGCMANIREARVHLEGGRIAERSNAINRAHAILTELTSSLDLSGNNEFSLRLANLYQYMEQRLLQANFDQADAPLVEVLGLLDTLSEAWEGVGKQFAPPEPVESAWMQQSSEETVGAHAWSF